MDGDRATCSRFSWINRTRCHANVTGLSQIARLSPGRDLSPVQGARFPARFAGRAASLPGEVFGLIPAPLEDKATLSCPHVPPPAIMRHSSTSGDKSRRPSRECHRTVTFSALVPGCLKYCEIPGWGQAAEMSGNAHGRTGARYTRKPIIIRIRAGGRYQRTN
jgi:hypothetical protein